MRGAPRRQQWTSSATQCRSGRVEVLSVRSRRVTAARGAGENCPVSPVVTPASYCGSRKPRRSPDAPPSRIAIRNANGAHGGPDLRTVTVLTAGSLSRPLHLSPSEDRGDVARRASVWGTDRDHPNLADRGRETAITTIGTPAGPVVDGRTAPRLDWLRLGRRAPQYRERCT